MFILVLLKICFADSCVYSRVANSFLCRMLCLFLCCWSFVVQKVVFILVLLKVSCADSCVYSRVAKSLLCRILC